MNESKYIVDPNGERRAGCFGNAIRYGVGGGIIALLLWVALSMCGCKSQCVPERYEVHDTIVRVDSVYKTHTRDSIVYRDRQDSTYIREKDSTTMRTAGDTIYVVQYRTREVYKYQKQQDQQTKTENKVQDSKSKAKEKSTEQEVIVKETRYIPKFYKVVTWTAIAWLLIRIVWCVLGWIPQTSPWRNMVQRVIDKIVKFIRLR